MLAVLAMLAMLAMLAVLAHNSANYISPPLRLSYSNLHVLQCIADYGYNDVAWS